MEMIYLLVLHLNENGLICFVIAILGGRVIQKIETEDLSEVWHGSTDNTGWFRGTGILKIKVLSAL